MKALEPATATSQFRPLPLWETPSTVIMSLPESVGMWAPGWPPADTILAVPVNVKLQASLFP